MARLSDLAPEHQEAIRALPEDSRGEITRERYENIARCRVNYGLGHALAALDAIARRPDRGGEEAVREIAYQERLAAALDALCATLGDAAAEIGGAS